MGEIRESLVLEDRFTNSFSRFIGLGGQSVSQMARMGSANQKFTQSMALTGQQLASMKSVLASQQAIHTAQVQRLQAQGEKIADLAQKYKQLETEKGMDAAATLRASQALARAQISEQNMLQQSLRTEQAILRQNQAIEQFVKKMGEADSIGRKASGGLANGMGQAAISASKMAKNIDEAKSAQDRLGDSAKRTDDISKRLLSTAARIAAAFGGIRLAAGLIGLSDTMAQTQARLGMVIKEVDGGLGTTQGLQEMIYQSAQRTRGAYLETADAVSKLGLMAGDAFGSSEEIVAFMEQVNKQFKIAGTESAGIQAAMLQLTQAMGSGVLRGEEYNSILEQAPNIIQSIADYLEVPKGKLKDMASEGAITADVIKSALFAAADETNAKFESLPMTYDGAWALVKNAGIKALDQVSDKLNDFLNSAAGGKMVDGLIRGFEVLADVASGAIDLMSSGAEWAVDNWDYIYPVLIGIGAAFVAAGVAGVASGLVAAAAWSPVTMLIIGIGAGMAFLVFTLAQSGVSFEQMGAVAGGVLGGLYTAFYTMISYWWNLVATFAEFFANVFDNPVTAIANLFAGLLDAILSAVQTAASAIDALLGGDISGKVAGLRNTINDFVVEKYGENQVKIKRMGAADVGANVLGWAQMGKNFGKKLDDFNFNLEGFTEGFGGSGKFAGAGGASMPDIGKVGKVGSVKKVEDDIRLSDEDVKLYRDLAERRYMNEIELKTLAPQIQVVLNAAASGALKPQDVADCVKKILVEQMNAQTAVAHG